MQLTMMTAARPLQLVVIYTLLLLHIRHSSAYIYKPGDDLMQHPCFVASNEDINNYNEFGFKTYHSGDKIGAWNIEEGDVDEYYIPAIHLPPENNVNNGSSSSSILPANVPASCTSLLDINGERASTISQIFPTIPNGTYVLDFIFAGDPLQVGSTGPQPSSSSNQPYFKSMQLLWNDEKMGDIYINSMEKDAIGMDWDDARYSVRASEGKTSVLKLRSTTKGRSTLFVTNFHLIYLGVLNDNDNNNHPEPSNENNNQPFPPSTTTKTPAGGGNSVYTPPASAKEYHGSWISLFLAILGLVIAFLFMVFWLSSSGYLGVEVGESFFFSSLWPGDRERGRRRRGGESHDEFYTILSMTHHSSTSEASSTTTTTKGGGRGGGSSSLLRSIEMRTEKKRTTTNDLPPPSYSEGYGSTLIASSSSNSSRGR